MKKLMFFYCFSLLSAMAIGTSIDAQALTFELECTWDSDGVEPSDSPRYSVIKKASKRRNGKWKTEYFLKVQALNQDGEFKSYSLKSAGSGDEGYTEYEVVNPDDELQIQGATINTARFQWASLINLEGESIYRCKL